MKPIFSKKSLTALISMVMLCAGIVLACADGGDAEYGVSNFTPEAFVKPAYSPFFYSDMYYYGIGHDEMQNTRFNDQNVKDWSSYLGPGITKKGLHFLLEKAAPVSIDSAYRFVTANSNAWPASFRMLVPADKRNDQKMAAFIKYLHFARLSEKFAVNEIQYWNYDSTKKPVKFDATAFNAELKQSLAAAQDSFVKQRYWFQLERSFFYNGSAQDVLNAFDTTMPRNVLYYRALAYLAGAYYKNKEFGKANYYYSQVYEHCDALKTTAHYSFHPQEENDWQQTLALCKNAEEQIVLWQMLGVRYADEKRSIEAIYALNPKSQKLDLLLSRAVNRYEQKFGGNGSGIVVSASGGYEDSLKKLVERVARAGNTAKPWTWNMAAGYLNTLDQHYASAKPFFDQASGTLPSEKLAQEQFRLLKLINRVGAQKKIDTVFENEMIGSIDWLNSFKDNDPGGFRNQDAWRWLKQTFAARYEKQGELAKSECFVNHNSFYARPENLEAMKAFLAKPSKTPYEELCQSLSEVKLNDIYEFEAIIFTYRDSIDPALEKMKQAGAPASIILPGNPFNARIQDCHDCDFAAPQKIKYSELSFLQKIKELKEKVGRQEDVYVNAVLLGNAYYNLSQYGNARTFYECRILGSSHSDPYGIDSVYRNMLTSQETAMKYYLIAASEAKTDEQKAKSQYLIAKVQRNAWYNQHVYSKPEDWGSDAMVKISDLSAFDSLKQYPNTQYYKEVLRECGYFKTFVLKSAVPVKGAKK